MSLEAAIERLAIALEGHTNVAKAMFEHHVALTERIESARGSLVAGAGAEPATTAQTNAAVATTKSEAPASSAKPAKTDKPAKPAKDAPALTKNDMSQLVTRLVTSTSRAKAIELLLKHGSVNENGECAGVSGLPEDKYAAVKTEAEALMAAAKDLTA